MANLVKTLARNPETMDLIVDVSGNLAMAVGKEAYAQIINAKMRTSLGEKQLDVTGGLPYFQTVFADKSLVNIWQAEAVKMLESLPFVIRVISFDCDIADDMVQYTSEIETDEGSVIING